MPRIPLGGRAETLHRVACVAERSEDLSQCAVSRVEMTSFDLRLERGRRRALAMVVDRDDVPALARDEVEDASKLARAVRDEHANREVAAGAGQPEPHDRDERRRVDVPAREHDRDRVRIRPPRPGQQGGEAAAPAPSTSSFFRSRQSTSASEISSSDTSTMSSSVRSRIEPASSPRYFTEIPSAIVRPGWQTTPTIRCPGIRSAERE